MIWLIVIILVYMQTLMAKEPRLTLERYVRD